MFVQAAVQQATATKVGNMVDAGISAAGGAQMLRNIQVVLVSQ